MRYFVLPVALALCAAATSAGATLEKLSLEEMAQKSTLIVRGRVGACTGEARGPVIYTRCGLTVSERWKGQSGAQVDFFLPGGTAQGLRQNFGGAPQIAPGAEYVLFLWAGKSGLHQVVGLSQGVFDLKLDSKGVTTARREASTERMLDRNGAPVQDVPVEMGVAELKSRVSRALAAAEAVR